MISSTSCSEAEDLLEARDRAPGFPGTRATSFSRSRPVRRCRRMSRMACAWISLNCQRAISPSFASWPVRLARMSVISSSSTSSAWTRPSRTCARSSALRRSKRVRRTTISLRCSMKCRRIVGSGMTSGLLLTMARKMMPNVVCICVLRYRWLSTISAMASRLSSMTMRMPSRSDSSRRSEMPSMRLSLHQLGDLLEQARLVRHVRHFRHDDLLLLALLLRLDDGAARAPG